MDKKNRFLVVEDDAALNQGLALALGSPSCAVTQAFTLSEARDKLRESPDFDLIILDIRLPDGDGLAFCKELRLRCHTPVLFLTANDTELDIVMGLEAGGDDYITKPFSLAILRARTAALLRRSGMRQTDNEHQPPGRISVNGGKLVFDFSELRFFKQGAELVLSRTEQQLLKLLLHNKGNTLPRETLLEKIWGNAEEGVYENALSVTVSRLRGKLEDNPAEPLYIKTVYGIGYKWTEETGK